RSRRHGSGSSSRRPVTATGRRWTSSRSGCGDRRASPPRPGPVPPAASAGATHTAGRGRGCGHGAARVGGGRLAGLPAELPGRDRAVAGGRGGTGARRGAGLGRVRRDGRGAGAGRGGALAPDPLV